MFFFSSEITCVMRCTSSEDGCVGATYNATTLNCELGSASDLDTGLDKEAYLVPGDSECKIHNMKKVSH